MWTVFASRADISASDRNTVLPVFVLQGWRERAAETMQQYSSVIAEQMNSTNAICKSHSILRPAHQLHT
jgi:hypothetical protein